MDRPDCERQNLGVWTTLETEILFIVYLIFSTASHAAFL
jgi:hypothetical protein